MLQYILVCKNIFVLQKKKIHDDVFFLLKCVFDREKKHVGSLFVPATASCAEGINAAQHLFLLANTANWCSLLNNR